MKERAAWKNGKIMHNMQKSEMQYAKEGMLYDSTEQKVKEGKIQYNITIQYIPPTIVTGEYQKFYVVINSFSQFQ